MFDYYNLTGFYNSTNMYEQAVVLNTVSEAQFFLGTYFVFSFVVMYAANRFGVKLSAAMAYIGFIFTAIGALSWSVGLLPTFAPMIMLMVTILGTIISLNED